MSLHRFFAIVLCMSFVCSVPTIGMSTENMKKFGLGVMAFVVSEVLRFGFREACIQGGAQLWKSNFGLTSDEARAADKYKTIFWIDVDKPNPMDFVKIPVKALGVENILLALVFKSPEWYVLGATTDIVKGFLFHGANMVTSNTITGSLDSVCGPGSVMTNSYKSNRLDGDVMLGCCLFDGIKFYVKMALAVYVTKNVMPVAILRKFDTNFLAVATKIGIEKWFKAR